MWCRWCLIRCALVVSLVAHVGVAAESPLPEAREQYRLGLELYDERQYEAALEKFRVSYEAFPSPNSLLYVARCLRAAGNTHAAIEAYEETVRVAGDRAVTELKYADTYRAARRELAVLKPLPPPKQRYVAATWTTAAAGVAGLASFGTFWALANSRYHSLETHCSPLPCSASQSGAVESGRNYQLAANVSLAVGVTGAVTAVTLYILGKPRPPSWGQFSFNGMAISFSGVM
jgi:tetratricopeptide (TPR) repeat protein